MTLISVFIGGGLGAVARFALTRILSEKFFTIVPLGTLVENVGGSILVGFLFESLERAFVPGYWRAMLMIGFIGAFTTFSTYALETVMLLQKREYAASALNFLLHNFLGFVAVAIGIVLADLVRIGLSGGAHA